MKILVTCSGFQSLLMGADASTWTQTINQLVEKKVVAVAAFELELNYDYWTYRTCVLERPFS